MPKLELPERERLRRTPSAISSLAGMEKPFSSKEITFDIYQDPTDVQPDRSPLDKPLPPTPRKPSSVYSLPIHEDRQTREHRLRNDLLPSSIFLAPTSYRSSTSKLPDPTPPRPKLSREAASHLASDREIEQAHRQVRPSGHTSHLQQEVTLEALSISASQTSVEKAAAMDADSVETHEEQLPVRHTHSPTPSPNTSASYHASRQRTPSPMSGRITDVVDKSLLPAPLRFTSLEESERPGSRFSSSSSEDESRPGKVRNSLRGMARKAFHFRKESKDTDETEWAAFTRYQERTASTPRRQSRIGSFVEQRRTSLQQSISGMYDTLTSLTGPHKGSKPAPLATNAPPKPHKPRIRSPAIPLTPYQELGPKVLETASKSSKRSKRSEKSKMENDKAEKRKVEKGESEVRSRSSKPAAEKPSPTLFTTPAYGKPHVAKKEPKSRSMVGKLTSALSSGTVQVESAVGLNTHRVKRTKSEKKRAELKKKIRIVGLGEPSTARTPTRDHWL
ncbi:MAG: hypothetical protein Q9183_000754 [Haloplaca sp. 2 TL-2023]